MDHYVPNWNSLAYIDFSVPLEVKISYNNTIKDWYVNEVCYGYE